MLVKRKVNYTNGYEVIDPVSLPMLINNGIVNDIVYQHFNQPNHSILSMRVRIIEKIYHKTNNPHLATPLRRKKEDYWIR